MTNLLKLTSKREKGGSFLRKTFLTLVAMLMAIPAFAQTVDVSGTVIDDQGEPLIGVTVMVEGDFRRPPSKWVLYSISFLRWQGWLKFCRPF